MVKCISTCTKREFNQRIQHVPRGSTINVHIQLFRYESLHFGQPFTLDIKGGEYLGLPFALDVKGR